MQNISALFGPWLIGFYSLLFVSIAFLYLADPASRKRVGMTAFLAACSLAGILGTDLLGGSSSGGLVKLVIVMSRLFAVIAVINVAGVFVFSLLLPKVKAGISKFIEDLFLAGAYIVAGLAVISASGANRSREDAPCRMRSIASAGNRLGVPPPKNTLCTVRPQTSGRSWSRSASSAST